MMNDPMIPGTSPFDAIRRVRPDGTEYWAGRELMPLLGYESWRRFADAVDRARATAMNTGHSLSELFATSVKKGDGRPAEDVELARFAAYLVAMNGDPRKPEVAAAQAYFAVKAREAEVTKPRELSRLELIEIAHEAELGRLAAEEQVAELTQTNAVLTPKAKAHDVFLSTVGDYSVGEAAKILSRDHGILTGEKRLFAFMQQIGWIYRDAKRKPIPYQAQVDNGRLVAKARFWFNSETGEPVADAPQIRITAKGLEALRRKYLDGRAA